MTTWFDAPTFAASVRTKCRQRSLREVSAEIGTVSPSPLSRIERGAVPAVETFLRLCDWLKLPTSAFIQSDPSTRNQPGSEDSSQMVRQALRANGVLSPEVISAFVTLIHTVRMPQASNSTPQ